MNNQSCNPVSSVIELFLDEKAASLSPYSVIHLRRSLGPMARAIGDPPIGDVTYQVLRAYVDGLHMRYRPNSIRGMVGDIRQFWRWAKKRGHVSKNPAKQLHNVSRAASLQSRKERGVAEADVRSLIDDLSSRLRRVVYRDLFGNLSALPSDEWTYEEQAIIRDLLIVTFLYETGGRCGELWRMSSRAMDDALTGPGPVYRAVSTGKTGTTVLWFTAATAELWTIWREVRPIGCEEYAVVGWRKGRYPKPMKTLTIANMFVRRCRDARIPTFRAHALRHAKVQRGMQAVGLEMVSKLVGHSSAIVTEGYARVSEQQLQAAALATGLNYRPWGK